MIIVKKKINKNNEHKPALGSGERFRRLKSKLATRGATTPGALAAWIGRKKYGKKKMAKLSAEGRKRK